MDYLLFLVFSFTLLFSFSKISTVTDTLIPTQDLRDKHTLVSSGQIYELGFFSPGISKNWYLGIWYMSNIPTKTIVWVANRNNPLIDPSGLLKIDDNGNLVLVNRTKSIIWSSSKLNQALAKNPIAQLLDSGNLVLKYEGQHDPESYIWQSFDYPSDTLLAGMKLGCNLKTGMIWNLTAWKSPDDPSPGDFTYGIDPRGFPQLILHNGSVNMHRTGPWNGLTFSGAPRLGKNVLFDPIFVSDNEEVYYTVQSNYNTRLWLTPTGVIERLYWISGKSEWQVIYKAEVDQCDKYGFCGAYDICNIENTTACYCIEGFAPKSPHRSGGCIRTTPLVCNNNGDTFKKFESVKLPDSSGSWVNKSMNTKECEGHCFRNCSCTAYANSDVRGGGSGCVLWFGDLVDIRQFPTGGQDLYLRMAASKPVTGKAVNVDSRKKTKRVVLMISISVVVGILSLGSITCCVIWKARKKQTGNEESIQTQDYTDENLRGEMDLPLFDFVTIKTATNNFSSDNKLGEGGFGPVHKGELQTGQEIAVKRLSKFSGQGLNEFKNEVILIAKLQHRNLVRLLGCCIQREEKMLIYEYMPNKSLDFFIFDQERNALLSWQKRFDIVVGIAQGLLYLHRDSRLRIVHRDLKASNVLLDSEMNPKISDFGMARTFGGNQVEAVTARVVGTYGYMSPEYAIDGLFSMKSDVFSFGVLMLEIISGKKNRGFDHPDHDLNLLGHAWKLWNEARALELVDMLVEDGLPESQVLRYIQVGLLCVQQCPEDRPSMSSVVLMLGSETSIMLQPKQPGFYNERNLIEADTSSNGKKLCTNEVTVSLLQGR